MANCKQGFQVFQTHHIDRKAAFADTCRHLFRRLIAMLNVGTFFLVFAGFYSVARCILNEWLILKIGRRAYFPVFKPHIKLVKRSIGFQTTNDFAHRCHPHVSMTLFCPVIHRGPLDIVHPWRLIGHVNRLDVIAVFRIHSSGHAKKTHRVFRCVIRAETLKFTDNLGLNLIPYGKVAGRKQFLKDPIYMQSMTRRNNHGR